MIDYIVVSVIILPGVVWLVTSLIRSAKIPEIRFEVEQEYQERYKQLESEFAEKEAALKERERKVEERERELKKENASLKKKGADLPEWMSSSEELYDKLVKCKEAAVDIGLEMLGIEPILMDLLIAEKPDSEEMLFSIWRNVKEHRQNIYYWLDDIKNLVGICPMETPICELNEVAG